MKDKEEKTISIKLIKEGKNPKNWIKMETVNDIYKQALLLNRKERKKLLNGFRDMIEISVNYTEACNAITEGGDSKLDITAFKWCND